MISVDLASTSIRDLNDRLHKLPPDTNERAWRVVNPKGAHAIAAGLNLPIEVDRRRPCRLLLRRHEQGSDHHRQRPCGVGVGENIMSGEVRVKGNASQSAAASGQGGLVVIEGDACARCGISMKGVDIVVGGSVGHMSAFMAQTGSLVVCGDAGGSLGNSIYEAKLYVQGKVESLGADCIEKKMTPNIVGEAGAPAGACRASRPTPSASGATARRASSTTSTSTTSTPTSAGDRGATRMTVDPRGLRPSHSFPPHILSRDPPRRRQASMTSAATAPSARCPLRRSAVPRRLDLALSAGRLSREMRHRRGARHPLRQEADPSQDPVTIAGMSFGALGANAKEALGRGATQMGTSTTTGDGGMTPGGAPILEDPGLSAAALALRHEPGRSPPAPMRSRW